MRPATHGLQRNTKDVALGHFAEYTKYEMQRRQSLAVRGRARANVVPVVHRERPTENSTLNSALGTSSNYNPNTIPRMKEKKKRKKRMRKKKKGAEMILYKSTCLFMNTNNS